MPSTTRKRLPNRESSKREPRKRPKRIKRAASPLRYWSRDEAAWLEHDEIRVHAASLQFPALEKHAFAGLTREIIGSDGSVRLTTSIEVTQSGAIVDGRHRARVLVEAGQGDELARQIEAGGGEWVTRIPKGVDPYVHAVRSQSTRRNLPAWQMALTVISQYRAAVAEGESQRGKKGKKPGELSPSEAFCKSVAISRTVFHQIDRLDRRASAEDMNALRAGQISLSELERKLMDAAERREQPKGQGPARASKRKEKPSSSGHETSSEATRRNGSSDIDCRPAVELIDQLLTVKPDKRAEANAAALFTALEDVARDRLIHAARNMASI